MATAFDEARLAKRRVRENEGVSPRIGWLGRVCIGFGQEGLAKSVVGALPVLSAGMMARKDWPEGVTTAFAEAVLAVALKF